MYRTRRLLFSGIVAATAVALVAGTGVTAAAQTKQMPDLPEPCKPIALNVTVDGIELRFGDQTVTTAPLEGTLSLVPAPNPDDPQSMLMRLAGFFLTTGVNGGEQAGDLGSILITATGIDTAEPDMLTLIPGIPPRFKHTVSLGFTLIIEKSPIPGVAREPLVLTTKEPAVVVGNISSFPPQGDLYQLQNPVDLVLPDNADQTIARSQSGAGLLSFPIKVGGQ